MDAEPTDTIKHREIRFRGPHADSTPALTAARALAQVEGILHSQALNATTIKVSYDLHYVSLQLIDELLYELGFHLDNSLLVKLQRALYYYTEDLQRETLDGQHLDNNNTQAVFINRYRHLEHGCRDVRPDHWRQYL